MTARSYEVTPNTPNDVPLQPVGDEPSLKEGLSEEPYDPHLHRNRPSPTKNWETLVHLLKSVLGTGILAMPNAFYNSGLIVGTVFTVLIGMLCTYCLHVLVRSQYELCKSLRVPILSYPQSMEKALERGPNIFKRFAKYSPIIVDIFLIIYQLGICCVYVVFVASNIKSVMDYHIQPIDVRLYMLMLLIPLILINYIRNLKKLAPLSTFANIITFIGLGIVLYYIFVNLPHINSVNYFGTLKDFPLFVGTTLFALEAVGVIIALENNMKTPKNFGGYCGVLNQGTIISVTFYVVVGFFGYVKYGDKVLGSVTLNLPSEEILAQSVKILFSIAIFITYALQSYVPVDIIWNTYVKKRCEKSKHILLYEYLLRTCFAILTFLFAVAIPNLELVISLCGALCLSALGIVFPGIIELCTYWPDRLGRCKYILIKDILLLIGGVLAFVVGTYCSAIDIVTTLF